jgi:hypothetical protein
LPLCWTCGAGSFRALSNRHLSQTPRLYKRQRHNTFLQYDLMKLFEVDRSPADTRTVRITHTYDIEVCPAIILKLLQLNPSCSALCIYGPSSSRSEVSNIPTLFILRGNHECQYILLSSLNVCFRHSESLRNRHQHHTGEHKYSECNYDACMESYIISELCVHSRIFHDATIIYIALRLTVS